MDENDCMVDCMLDVDVDVDNDYKGTCIYNISNSKQQQTTDPFLQCSF